MDEFQFWFSAAKTGQKLTLSKRLVILAFFTARKVPSKL
jgi:hypothetical protein